MLLSGSLPASHVAKTSSNPSLVDFAKSFAKRPSPPCYLIFSTPDEAVVVQKDFLGGSIKSTRNFLVQANHDTDHTACCGDKEFHHRSLALGDSSLIPPEDAWLSQSAEREIFVSDSWAAHSRISDYKRSVDYQETREEPARNGSCISLISRQSQGQNVTVGITRQTLQKWMSSYPVFNEYTHFATIMDPLSGDVVYLERQT